LGLLREGLCDADRIGVDAIDDAPRGAFVDDTQLMTTLADGRHRPRVRQAQCFATLQAAQELSGLDTRAAAVSDGVRTSP
jgi:hypothetical protein